MRASFDPVAPGYDAVAFSRLGRLLRARVHRRLFAVLGPESRVLDLGGGTGIDAVLLARAGHRVTLVDSSSQMTAAALGRARSAGVELTAVVGDLEELGKGSWRPPEVTVGDWDLVLSNFGALNGVSDPAGLLDSVAAVTAPEARALLVVMGRVCPWELARGQRRRLGGRAAAADGSTAPVHYHRPSDFSRSLQKWRESGREALGWALPPFENRGLVEDRPRLAGVLDRLDRVGAPLAGGMGIGDHWMMILERNVP